MIDEILKEFDELWELHKTPDGRAIGKDAIKQFIEEALTRQAKALILDFVEGTTKNNRLFQ